MCLGTEGGSDDYHGHGRWPMGVAVDRGLVLQVVRVIRNCCCLGLAGVASGAVLPLIGVV